MTGPCQYNDSGGAANLPFLRRYIYDWKIDKYFVKPQALTPFFGQLEEHRVNLPVENHVVTIYWVRKPALVTKLEGKMNYGKMEAGKSFLYQYNELL